MATSKRSRSFPGKSIVVGVDAEGLSDHAVRMGLELGERFSVPVQLVHAVPEIPDVWPGVDPVRSAEMSIGLLEGAQKTIAARVGRVVGKKRASGARGSASRGSAATAVISPPKGQIRIVQGHPAKALLEEVRARKAGLVVLGPHRKKERFDFSNTLRAVLARSEVPVWTQAQPVRAIRRIVAGVDLSPESLSALGVACALAKAFGARILAVHCFDSKKLSMYVAPDPIGYAPPVPVDDIRESEVESFEKAMKRFDWRGVAHETRIVEGEPVESLLDRSANADLVVLGTHGRTGLASVVVGSVAYALLKRAQKPTVVVPKRERAFKI